MKLIKNTTGTVFSRILKLTSLCLCSIIVLSCTSTNSHNLICRMMIPSSPPPSFQYLVSGTIRSSDSTHKALEWILVSLKRTPFDYFDHTDSLGKYNIVCYTRASTWILHAEDEGSYNKDTIITIPDSILNSANGSLQRRGKTTVDLYLDPK